jgi:hypothetical protein
MEKAREISIIKARKISIIKASRYFVDPTSLPLSLNNIHSSFGATSVRQSLGR